MVALPKEHTTRTERRSRLRFPHDSERHFTTAMGGCQVFLTSNPGVSKFSDEMRQQAARLYADGMSYRQTGRHLGVDHVTAMNWVKAHVDQLPAAEEAAAAPFALFFTLCQGACAECQDVCVCLESASAISSALSWLPSAS